MGETLHGNRFHMGFGGKGANQAVMAAKLGGDVTMISKLGRDVFGENTLTNFLFVILAYRSSVGERIFIPIG